MSICDSCKRLAATSKRSAVPSHLIRVQSGAPAEQYRAHYRCLSCQSQWRWVAPTTWMLILPPASSHSAPGQARVGWWMVLGQLLSGSSRHGRRAPIEMRPPRLPRVPVSRPVPPPKPLDPITPVVTVVVAAPAEHTNKQAA